MSSARARGRQAQCISNLNQLQQGLKMFKNDNQHYPAVLSAYAEQGKSLDNVREGFLFREYVKTPKGFNCPDSGVADMTLTVPDPMAAAGISTANRPATLPGGQPAALYQYDSYSSQSIGGQVQPRYTLGWANTQQEVVSLGVPAADADLFFMRQMKFKNPPDDTVVTWCAYHRGGDRNPQRGGAMDLVLFLDGHVDRISSNQLYPAGGDWRRPYVLKPKP